MQKTATLTIDDQTFTLATREGSEGEKAIDIKTLRSDSGYITYDPGYANTGSCVSDITYIDGEKGILRHRGYPIEQLARRTSFLNTAYLVIYGDLPTQEQEQEISQQIAQQVALHEGMHAFFKGYPINAHPMAILSATFNSLGCYYPEMASNNRKQDLDHFKAAAAILISKVRTVAAVTYRIRRGLPITFPKPDLSYTANFLHMMFSNPYDDYLPEEDVVQALDLFLLLHADHEQNCSTSTVRMVASGGANLFASVAAGVCALWGPLHGGANTAVLNMLQTIYEKGDDGSQFIEKAKNGQARLMGFGHRVYKNFDPRAKLLCAAAEKILKRLGSRDPLLDIACHLADTARKDSYFIERKLYPNVDFYSGILLKVIGIPVELFTVLFAMGRLPGWIANWKECAEASEGRIHRPRQIYTGPTERDAD